MTRVTPHYYSNVANGSIVPMTTDIDHTPSLSQGLFNLMVWLAVPYIAIGCVWASNHTRHLGGVNSADYFFSFAGEVLVWPLLTFSDITLE